MKNTHANTNANNSDLLSGAGRRRFAQDNPPKTASTQSDAKKAFAELKTLSGSWQGTVMAKLINITIRITSSGNVILNEATAEGGGAPNHEITTFYVEGIVCSRPIIVTPEIVRTWKAS